MSQENTQTHTCQACSKSWGNPFAMQNHFCRPGDIAEQPAGEYFPIENKSSKNGIIEQNIPDREINGVIRELERVIYRIAVRLWQIDWNYPPHTNPSALDPVYFTMARAAYDEMVIIEVGRSLPNPDLVERGAA